MSKKKQNTTQETNLEQGIGNSDSEIRLTENGELEGALGWEDVLSKYDNEKNSIKEANNEKVSLETEEEDYEEETTNNETDTTTTTEDTETTNEPTKTTEEKDGQRLLKETQQSTIQEQQKQSYYTIEELMDLSLDKINPNRLPPALQKIYKSMQADYTRKTQEVAKVKKAAQSILQDVMLKPLGQLPTDVITSITKQADAIVKSQLGDTVDDFDSDYISLKAAVVQELATQYKRQVQTAEVLQRTEQMLRASEPNYVAIEQLALQMIPTLPYARVMEIEQAKQTGNVEPLIQLFEEARSLYYSKMLANQANEQLASGDGNLTRQVKQNTQKQTNTNSKLNPPAVESGGQLDLENAQPKPKVSVRDLAGKSPDQQADLLIKLGLV